MRRPAQRREVVEDIDARAVYRDGLSEESYQLLEDATGVSELQQVLLEIFEPSQESGGGDGTE